MSREKKLLRAAAKGSLRRLVRIFGDSEKRSVTDKEHVETCRTTKKRKQRDSTDDSGDSGDDDDDDRLVRTKRLRKDTEKSKLKEEISKKKKRSRKDISDGDTDESESPETGKRKERRKRKEERNRKKRRFRSSSVNINCCDSEGWTPLHHSAHSGRFEAVAFLVSQGSDVYAKDKKGRTPAQVAHPFSDFNLLSLLQKRPSIAENDIRSEKNQPSFFSHNESKNWHEHMFEHMSDEEGWGGGGGGVGGNCWDDLEQDGEGVEDTWWEDVAAAMRRKKLEAAREWENQWNSRREKDREEKLKQSDEREAREREARRILAEEEAKDMAWRGRLMASKFQEQQLQYEKKWSTFSTTCNLGIGVGDIPFPVSAGKEGEMREVLLYGVPPEDQRKRIRSEILKWHPDKFLQRWGGRLQESAKESVLERVNSVFHAVQEIYEKLPSNVEP